MSYESIYGRKYEVIFLEINSLGQNSRRLPQPQQTKPMTDFYVEVN